ncbi:transposase [Spirochaetia bacterium]|nr:transposase [Spirochaetia bacterium]
MVINRALKIRIYPNKEQEQFILKNLGCCRFIYNQMLAEHKFVYEQLKNDKLTLYKYKYKTEKEYKQEFEWLKDADAVALQQSRMDLSIAYQNFFKRLKKKVNSTQLGFPKFHKRGVKDSYRSINNGGIFIDFNLKKVKLPKISWIKFRDPRIIDDINIKSATISKTKTGKYFVSLLYEKEIFPKQINLTKPNLKTKGLDMSLANLFVDEQGSSPEYKRLFRTYEPKLSKLQQVVSRRQLGSNRRKKAQLRVNKVYEKITNTRKDFNSKLSRHLVNNNDVIVVEDLNLQAMAQSLKLGKSVNDLGYGQFRFMLKYKAQEAGKVFIEANKWFASSKTCHVCGFIKKDLALSERDWVCSSCGEHHHRDTNAAINLADYGLKEIGQGMPKFTLVDIKALASEAIVNNADDVELGGRNENIDLHII